MSSDDFNYYWFLGWTIFSLVNYLLLRLIIWSIKRKGMKLRLSEKEAALLKKMEGPPPHLEWQSMVKFKDIYLMMALFFALLTISY